MAMSTPSWLYYLFGVLMLAVAAYCLTLLVLSVATNRPAGRDVEISHIFMGVAMAGMFVGQWAFGRSAVWEIIFGALLIWFLVESIQSVRTYGLHLPHALIHAVMNFAMLLMYWFPMGSSTVPCRCQHRRPDRSLIRASPSWWRSFSSRRRSSRWPLRTRVHRISEATHRPMPWLVHRIGWSRSSLGRRRRGRARRRDRRHSVAGRSQSCRDVHRHGLHASAHDLGAEVPGDGTWSASEGK